MREIKLRAWHTPLQKMLFPEKIHLDNWLCTAFDYLQDNLVYQIKTENNMWLDLMQFTWLLDKNGKEIYEGDIVKTIDDWDSYWWNAWSIGEVVFYGYYYALKRFNWEKIIYPQLDFESNNDCEIIWTIYENPELLTK